LGVQLELLDEELEGVVAVAVVVVLRSAARNSASISSKSSAV
jgi:hypothetical protein